MSIPRHPPYFPTRVSAIGGIILAFGCLVTLVPQPHLAAADPAPAQSGESFRTDAASASPGAVPGSGATGDPLAPIPPRPAGRLLDDARIFSPEQSAAIAATLREASERDGLDVFVVAATFVLGETVEDYSHRLAEAWMESPRGFILVYLRGEQTLTMSTPGNEGAFLSSQALRHVYETAIETAADAETAPERIRISLEAMLQGVHGALREQARMDRLFNPEVVRVLTFFLCALVVLGAAGWALARLFARLNQQQDARFVFPPTPIPPRFGAPFGGGVCAEIQFVKQRAG